MAKLTLAAIEKEISELHRAAISKHMSIAELLYVARENLFTSTTEWLEWARQNWGYQRRQCFVFRNVVLFLRNVEKCTNGALYNRLICLPIRKLDELATLDVSHLAAFGKLYALETISRDELRDAIAEYTGTRRPARFTGYSRLPDPEQLLLGLDDPRAIERIEFDTELKYISAHMQRISVVVGKAPQDQLVAFREHLSEDLAIIDRAIAGITP